MRTAAIKPEEKAPETKADPAEKSSAGGGVVIDLAEHLKKSTGTPPPPPKEEATTPEGEEKKAPGSAEYDEKAFTDFKDGIGKSVEGFVTDPKQFSELVVNFGNMLRMLVYPSIYRAILLEGDERKDIKPLLKKVATAKKENKKPELNDYEKELMEKWGGYLALKAKISYTDAEVRLLSSVLARHLQNIPIMEWLAKHDWILALAFIEAQRVIPVVGTRMGSEMADFTMTPK